jgi:carbonic anhydrase/acetyltransferase-like protein (isoleucine patch superfamily)
MAGGFEKPGGSAMMIKHRGIAPRIDDTAYVAPNAVVSGNVFIGPGSRIMYGAVLNSEGSRIEIGECAIICENAVIRATAAGDKDYPVFIGDHVFISPQATLLGCEVSSCAYIATGATVLQGARIHSGGVVAVGAFVHAKTVVPQDYFVPPNTIAVGDPVRLYSPDERAALTEAIKSIGFAKTAFNVEAGWEDRLARYKQATEVRSKEFGSHFDDVVIQADDDR